ncbi:MAG: sulfurtransferase complex subunit TusB [Halorhodospira sp.]
MLHTVNKSPWQTHNLDACLAHLGNGRLLLIEDGVYAAVAASNAAERLREPAREGRIYALGPDLEARGITREQVDEGIEIVDYAGFVQLVAEHGPHQAWL